MSQVRLVRSITILYEKGKIMKKIKKVMKKAGKKIHKEVKASKAALKIKKVMHEYKEDELHSGSKKGPKVTNPKQAIAIALSESRKVGKKNKK